MADQYTLSPSSAAAFKRIRDDYLQGVSAEHAGALSLAKGHNGGGMLGVMLGSVTPKKTKATVELLGFLPGVNLWDFHITDDGSGSARVRLDGDDGSIVEWDFSTNTSNWESQINDLLGPNSVDGLWVYDHRCIAQLSSSATPSGTTIEVESQTGGAFDEDPLDDWPQDGWASEYHWAPTGKKIEAWWGLNSPAYYHGGNSIPAGAIVHLEYIGGRMTIVGAESHRTLGGATITETKHLKFNLWGNPSGGTATLPLRVYRGPSGFASYGDVDLAFEYDSLATDIATQIKALTIGGVPLEDDLNITAGSTEIFPNSELTINILPKIGSSWSPSDYTFAFEPGNPLGSSGVLSEAWTGGWFQTYLHYRQCSSLEVQD